MNWTDLLTQSVEYNYATTDKLLDLVEDDKLDWKPETGDNWMTTGQLIRHIGSACGAASERFLTGDWGMPEGVNPADVPPDEMMPPAEKMEGYDSVAEAKEHLSKDKAVALRVIQEAGEERLASEPCPAPWDPTPMPLGMRMLTMVNHLDDHTGQLYYYLKLQGKPVNTMTRYGM